MADTTDRPEDWVRIGAAASALGVSVDTLRRFDLSESDEWKELGAAAKELAGLKLLFAETTQHGHNACRTNNGNVKARTLTGRDDPTKLIAVVNTKIGDYKDEELKLNQENGQLEAP